MPVRERPKHRTALALAVGVLCGAAGYHLAGGAEAQAQLNRVKSDAKKAIALKVLPYEEKAGKGAKCYVLFSDGTVELKMMP